MANAEADLELPGLHWDPKLRASKVLLICNGSGYLPQLDGVFGVSLLRKGNTAHCTSGEKRQAFLLLLNGGSSDRKC